MAEPPFRSPTPHMKDEPDEETNPWRSSGFPQLLSSNGCRRPQKHSPVRRRRRVLPVRREPPPERVGLGGKVDVHEAIKQPADLQQQLRGDRTTKMAHPTSFCRASATVTFLFLGLTAWNTAGARSLIHWPSSTCLSRRGWTYRSPC